MKTASVFAEGLGAGFGLALLVSLLLLLAARGSRVRVRLIRILQDPAPPGELPRSLPRRGALTRILPQRSVRPGTVCRPAGWHSRCSNSKRRSHEV